MPHVTKSSHMPPNTPGKPQTARGFALIEAIIILVIAGLITILALTSLQSVQAKSRDTQRRTDIDAIARALEDCYSDKDRCSSTYPSLNQLTDTFEGGFVASQLKSVNNDMLYDTSAGIIQPLAASPATQYQYTITPEGCTGTQGNSPCSGFTLRAYQETSPEQPYIKDSLNK